MENAIEERYVFLRSCSSDFSEALGLLEAATLQPPRIAYVLLRYAVIVYFRPFTKAETRFLHRQHDGSTQKRIRLSKDIVPPDLISFHDELKSYRDSAYAHSDLAMKNPRLFYWCGDEWEFPIALSPVDKKPLHIHQDEIKQLCEAGLEWVSSETRTMEKGFRVQFSEHP